MFKLFFAHKEPNYTPSTEPAAPRPQTIKPNFVRKPMKVSAYSRDPTVTIQWRTLDRMLHNRMVYASFVLLAGPGIFYLVKYCLLEAYKTHNYTRSLEFAIKRGIDYDTSLGKVSKKHI